MLIFMFYFVGADVIHPGPGADGRPSFTALVGNVDAENSKYVAKCAVQESRVEMIQDLGTMAKSIIQMSVVIRSLALVFHGSSFILKVLYVSQENVQYFNPSS